MVVDQIGKNAIDSNQSRRRLPRGCHWLLWGALVLFGGLILLIIGSVIYVDACGFPYVSTIQTQPVNIERAVITANNASKITELIQFNDNVESNSGNLQPRYQAVFSPTGQWLASGGAVKWASGYSCSSLWLINTKDFSSEVLSFGETNIPNHLVFSPNEQLLFFASYHRIDAIPPSKVSDRYTIVDYPPYEGTSLDMELAPYQGSMLMVLSNKQIPFLWDYDNRRQMITPLTPDIVITAKHSHDYIAYGTADGDAKLYHYDVDGNKTTRLLEAEDPVSIAFNHAGTLLKINDRASNKIFDVATKDILFEIPGSRIPLQFSPNDRYFVTGNGVWTLEDRQQILTFEESDYYFAEFSAQEDLLIMATYKGRIDIWDLNAKQMAFSIENNYTMSDVGFSPDQTLIAASFDGSDNIGPGIVKVWGIPAN